LLDQVRALLAPAALRFGVELSDRLVASLALYARRLLEWNQQINLSGARDLETLTLEHLADALALAPHLPATGRCIDVGSGAGLPGIVLALLRSDLDWQLLEPLQKRRAFLNAVVRELELRNVTISADRLEEHASMQGGAYDFAIARAVLPLPVWLAEGSRLVKSGGTVAGLAGGSPEHSPAGAVLLPYDAGSGPRTVVLVRQ
jgi:16S rRNA (guanine527-N7)-methyltransferase